MPETKKYPRLYLELLENKQKVREDMMFNEITYSILPSKTSEKLSSSIQKSVSPKTSPIKKSELPIIIKSPEIRPLEESLLEDIFSPETITQKEPPKEEIIVEKQITSKPPTPPLKDVIPDNVYKQVFQAPPQPIPEVKKPDPELLFKKQKLLVKFDILRKNGNRSIPIYSMDHDYMVMKKHYKLLVKQLHVDNKVTFYKQCLLGLCGCIEMGLGEAGLGLDMEGYTEFQANNMNKYEKLLIKIGEKSYMPSSVMQLPVEMQLCVTLIIQTMIFTSSKLLKNKIGFNISSLFGIIDDNNLQLPK
jgi:hypothetical protein